MNVQQQFEQVVSSSFDTLSAEELKPVAVSLWHENYTPKLANLDSTELQKAGYVIDLLASFNCVSEDRQLKLMKLTEEIRAKLSSVLEEMEALTAELDLDPIAKEWCLTQDVSDAVYDLLEYQTRHYVHT
ncbi:MAG: hypothetical protein AAFQ14_06705 [Cyanobacteria bacterium J06621_12]